MPIDLIQLFRDALDLDPASRAAFLDAHCADAALRARVEALLASAEAGGRLWPEPTLPDEYSPPAQGDRSGEMLGPFRLLKPLGSGGMGAVWLAERQGEFKQQVAIKWLHAGLSDSARQRFARERETLAKLEHPGIARIVDGGTDRGADWFAMEYVQGVPLDQSLATRSLGERIETLIRVCDAVQFAHQNLVVHRDLKPGNILIGSDGVPKLLDFGVSKLLDAPALTDSRAPMTFAYAAPEQIKGEAISTATDVYALGVILYEVLTGERPHKPKGDGSLSLLQAITDTDATAPSRTLQARSDSPIRSQQLRGDLDTIVLKALSRDPARRYPSVLEFRADLQRYLRGEPILARPATWAYRAHKFVRRNRFAVAAGVASVLALAGAAGYSRLQALRAQQAAADALSVQHFTLSLFEFSRPDFAPNNQIDALALMANAEQRLRAATDLSVAARLALIQTLDSFRFDRGEYTESLLLNDQRLALVANHFGTASYEYALAILSRGYTLNQLGNSDDAERDCAAGLARLPNVEVSPEHTERTSTCARLAAARGQFQLAKDRLALFETLIASRPREPAERAELEFGLHRSRGRVAMDEGRSAEALAHLDLALKTVLAAPEPWPSHVAGIHNDRALVQQRLGDYDGASASFQASLAIWREVVGEDSVYALQTLGAYAQMLIEAGRIPQAEALMQEKARYAAVLEGNTGELVRFDLQRAQLLHAMGSNHEALSLLAGQEERLNAVPQFAPAITLETARVLVKLSRPDEAIALLKSAPSRNFGRCIQGQWWFAYGQAATAAANANALADGIERLMALQRAGFVCRAAEASEVMLLRGSVH